MRRFWAIGIFAGLLLGLSTIAAPPLHAQVLVIEHDEIARDDPEYQRLKRNIEELRGSENSSDEQFLAAWVAMLNHVSENYPLDSDLHLDVLDDVMDIANILDVFGEHDVLLGRLANATYAAFVEKHGEDSERLPEVRKVLRWHLTSFEEQAEEEAEKEVSEGPSPELLRLRALETQAAGLSGDALIDNLIEQASLKRTNFELSISAVLTEIAIAEEMAKQGNLEQAIGWLEAVNADPKRAFADQQVLVGQYLAHYRTLAGDTEGAVAALDKWTREYDLDPAYLWPGYNGFDHVEPFHRVPQANAQRAQLLLKANLRPADALASARFTATFLRSYQTSPVFDAGTEDEISASRLAPEGEPFGQDARMSYSHLVEAAWRVANDETDQGEALREEAFAAAQDAAADSATAAIARTAAQAAASQAGLPELAQEREAIRLQLEDLANQIEPLGYSDPEATSLSEAYAKLLERQRQLDFDLARAAPEFFRLIRPKALSQAEARGLLRPGEALILIAPSEHATHVFALTQTETVWHRSALTASDIAEAVEFLRLDLDPWGSGLSDWDGGFPLAEAHRLYAELIQPLEAALSRSDVDTLLYAADGVLATVPLSVLLTEAPDDPDERSADFADLPWLGDRYALSQLPSLASLAYLRRGRGSRSEASESLASFGDPLLLGEAARRGARSGGAIGKGQIARSGTDALADVDQLRNLARLPGTRIELESLRAALGASPASAVLGESATETAIKSADLSRARFVAFATHGLLAGQAGEGTEPGLVFTPPASASASDDGLLSASEILTLELAADWVILSACNTAAGDGLGNEALSGMARAFFYAGARSLLASHWPVGDEIAPVLTVEAVSALIDQPGISRAKALQQAMRTARTREDIVGAAHPSSWAAFINIGDPL